MADTEIILGLSFPSSGQLICCLCSGMLHMQVEKIVGVGNRETLTTIVKHAHGGKSRLGYIFICCPRKILTLTLEQEFLSRILLLWNVVAQ